MTLALLNAGKKNKKKGIRDSLAFSPRAIATTPAPHRASEEMQGPADGQASAAPRAATRRFSPSEDQELLSLHAKFTAENVKNIWVAVAKEMTGRNNQECSRRWKNLPGVNSNTDWTPADDARLITCVRDEGHQWSKFLKDGKFPGRTIINLSNH
jgi:hypothetical protein